MDGARIANAAVSLNKTIKEITVDCGVDLISYGGTKNGLMNAECLIIFNETIAKHAYYVQKEFGSLLCKSKYISSQLIPYLENGIWKSNAEYTNGLAYYMYE